MISDLESNGIYEGICFQKKKVLRFQCNTEVFNKMYVLVFL